MKKQLLFSLAMVSGMVAFAASPVDKNEVPAAVASQRVKVSLSDVMLKSYTPQTSATEVAASVINYAEGEATDSMTACYQIPGGAFYVGGMQDHFSVNLRDPYLLIPNKVPLYWNSVCYKATENAKWYTSEWTYEKQVLEGNQIKWDMSTVDTDKLTTDPYYAFTVEGSNHFAPAPTFTINKAGDKGVRPSSFQASEAGLFAYNGRPRFNFGGDYGVQDMMLTQLNPAYSVGSFNGLTSAGAMEYGMVYFSIMPLGATYFSDSEATIDRFGAYLPAPAKTFGISAIAVRLVIDAFAAERMTFDIYEAEPISGKVTYQIGERLGGGYLDGSEIKADAQNYVDLILPVMEGEDGLESESFVNVDKGIVILIGGFKNDENTQVFMPIYVAPSSSPLFYMNKNVVAEFSEPLSYVRYITPGSTNNAGVKFTGATWAMQYIGQYATLLNGDEPEGYFDMDVPAEGGGKTFTFNAYFANIAENGKFTGEGANDWVLFDVAELDENTYNQDVTVEVDPLPDGVEGRQTTVYVEICGAKQAINITQGTVSGIDEVGADNSEVVATQYFDMQGRTLNAAPESGLYLKKEVRASGNVSTVKVAK